MPVQRQARTGILKVRTQARTHTYRRKQIFFVDTPYLFKHFYLVSARFFFFAFLALPPAVLTLDGLQTEIVFSSRTSQRRCHRSAGRKKKKNQFQSKVFLGKLKPEISNFSKTFLNPLVFRPGRGRCSAERSCFLLRHLDIRRTLTPKFAHDSTYQGI